MRIECTIEGHKGEWVEYKPIRLKDRLAYERATGEDEIWVILKSVMERWKITDADKKEVPFPDSETILDDIGELDEPMYAWLVGSFMQVVILGRSKAQSAPFSAKSD